MASLAHVVLRLCIRMGNLTPALAIVNVFGKCPGHAASHPFIFKKEMKTKIKNQIPFPFSISVSDFKIRKQKPRWYAWLSVSCSIFDGISITQSVSTFRT